MKSLTKTHSGRENFSWATPSTAFPGRYRVHGQKPSPTAFLWRHPPKFRILRRHLLQKPLSCGDTFHKYRSFAQTPSTIEQTPSTKTRFGRFGGGVREGDGLDWVGESRFLDDFGVLARNLAHVGACESEADRQIRFKNCLMTVASGCLSFRLALNLIGRTYQSELDSVNSSHQRNRVNLLTRLPSSFSIRGGSESTRFRFGPKPARSINRNP